MHQRHDRQHLRARAELEDREQVGQVVAQHVAGDRDRVLARARPREREPGRRRRPSGSRSAARRCRARPSAGRTFCSSSASWARVSSSQNTAGAPVARARDTASSTQSWIGGVLGLAHRARCRPRRPRARAASRRWRRSTTRTRAGLAISNVLSCDPYSSASCAISPTFGVVPIVAGSNAPWRGSPRRSRRRAPRRSGRGSRTCVSCCSPVGVPHLARGADRGGHRGVDDHVAGHVQVGDPAVGVDHRQRRAVGVGGVDRRR